MLVPTLEEATNRNSRILIQKSFEITGPNKEDWPEIIENTFSFHNDDKPLSDFGIIESDLIKIGKKIKTLGETIIKISEIIAEEEENLQNISNYQVILLWPVADNARNEKVLQFTYPTEGYKLNWENWYRSLNQADRKNLPLKEYNRARLYFDFRLVPIKAADLHKLCNYIDKDDFSPAKTYLKRLEETHFFLILSDHWTEYVFNTSRNRTSKRTEEAESWYNTITNKPTQVGRRLAKAINLLGYSASYEKDIETKYSKVRADVYVEKGSKLVKNKIVELKLYNSSNTIPSQIKDQIRQTLQKHAQLAGFIQKQ